MKRLSKKLLAVLLTAIIGAMSMTALNVSAISNNDVEYSYEGITEAKATQIFNAMVGIIDNSPKTRINVLCLFGHDIKTETVTKTEHNYYSNAPRCKTTKNNIEYCNRGGCDYVSVTSETVSRIACH